MQIIDEVADERCERSMNALIFLVEDLWSTEKDKKARAALLKAVKAMKLRRERWLAR